MARRHKAEKRPLTPDPRFHSELLGRLINQIMVCGKKSTAQTIVYGAVDTIKEKTGEDPIEIIDKAIDNIKPRLEVKSRRVGGATYQVPMEVSASRQMSLALRWLVQYSRAKKGQPMGRALANELMDAYNNQGSCVKKRDDTHKMAQANKAFAHYRW